MNAEVYTGKPENDPTFVHELGVTGSLVVRLSQHYRNQNICLYTDILVYFGVTRRIFDGTFSDQVCRYSADE